MAWIPITENNLLTAMSGDELAGVRAAALANAQEDPVAPSIAAVIGQVRGYVGRKHTLGAGATIPEKLLATALDLIVPRMLNRVNLDISSGRVTAAEDAKKTLDDVASGRFNVEEPETATPEVSAGVIGPAISAPKRRFTRKDQDGI